MKLSTRFAILAGILGLFYGIIAGALGMAVMAAVLYLAYLIVGPVNSWLNCGNAIVLIAGGAGFVVTFGIAIFFGYRFGKHAEGLSGPARAQAIKVFYNVFNAAAVVLVVVALLWWQHISNQRKAVERLDMQNKNRQQLGERVKAEKVKISALSIMERPDRSGFDILIDADSVRAGKYELSAAINHYGLNCRFFKGEVSMAAGKNTQTIFVAYAKLVDAAQQQINGSSKVGAGFMADYPCEVTFIQALSQNELEAMRSSQAYGRQEFVATGRVDIPLQFSMSGGEITACSLYKK